MMNSMYITMLIGLMSIVGTNSIVYISNGVLTIDSEKNCTIDVNGEQLKLNNTTADKYVHGTYIFGLVTYKCLANAGVIISKFDCKNCGMFCTYNSMFVHCDQSAFKMSIGVFFGTLVSLTSILVGWMLLKKYKINLWEEILYKFNKRHDNMRFREATRISKITGRPIEVSYRKHRYTNDGITNRLEMDKIKRMNKMQGKSGREAKTESEYIEITETVFKKEEKNDLGIYDPGSSSTDSKPMNYKELNEEIKKLKNHKSSPSRQPSGRTTSGRVKGNRLATAAVLGMLLSSHQQTQACDANLYISSMSKVCDENKCISMNMFTLPIHTGQSICFHDVNNNELKIKIERSYYRIRYLPLYYTSDWEVETDSYYTCKGSGQCWNGGCNIDTIGKSFVKDNSSLTTFGCQSDSLGCDTYCFHNTACTYYKYKVRRVKELVKVYKISTMLWEVDLISTYRNITKRITINVNNPSYNLVGLSSIDDIKLPMYVTNFMSESIYPSENVIQTSKSVIPIRASEMNMPQADIIGDYQVSLDHLSESFNMDSIKCSVSACRVKCEHPMPKIRKITNLEKNMPKGLNNYRKVSGTDDIEMQYDILGTVTIMLGNVDINNLQISPAHCKINIDYIYGCNACNVLPYVVMTKYNIKNEGLLEYESNCTFENKYISCNEEPYVMKLSKQYNYCMIFIQRTNQTMYFNVNYDFLGKLEPNAVTLSKESTVDIIKDITTSTQFWSGLVSTFTIFTGIGVIMSIVTRGMKIWAIGKANENSKV